MAEEENEKQKKTVRPGLVKSEGYTRPATKRIINPTLQTVVEDLPTAKKSEMFTQYYEEKMSNTNWIPPQDQLNITEEMMSSHSNEKQQDKTEIKLPEASAQKFQKQKPKDDKNKDAIIKETPKIADKITSDMELAMQQTKMINEAKAEKTKVSFDIPAGANVATPAPKEEKANVFGAVNEIKIEQPKDEKAKEAEEKKQLVQEKPFMRIDKVEVRTSINSDNEKVYMVGKKVYNKAKFMEYLQEISGKILAQDCKLVEIQGTEYRLQGDGSYKNSSGQVLSVDDMLSLVQHEK